MSVENGEKRWLSWLVRIILPALVAAQWIGLSADVAEVRRELAELRRELEEDNRRDAKLEAEQDCSLIRLETLVDGLLGQQGGGRQTDDHTGGQGR